MIETMIERVAVKSFGNALKEWKALQATGWSVTALLAPDKRTCVLLACRDGQYYNIEEQLTLF